MRQEIWLRVRVWNAWGMKSKDPQWWVKVICCRSDWPSGVENQVIWS